MTSRLDPSPVFIGGCDRSGTTLLGAILGAHSECLCVPKSPFKTEALRRQPPSGDLRPVWPAIVDDQHFALWGLDAALVRRELATTARSYPAALAWLVGTYGDRVGKWPARFWIDHTPANIWSGATLAAMFPRARFIHLVRDGRGVAASVLPLDFGPASAELAARWWSRALTLGLALESWAPDRVLRVRYEDIILTPEPTVRGIAAFLGLDYEERMLDADGFRLEWPAAHHALIGAPPQAARAHAWAESLSPRQLEIFESVAADLLRCLGYDVRDGSEARPPSSSERLIAAARERYQYWVRERLGARCRRARQGRFVRRRRVRDSA